MLQRLLKLGKVGVIQSIYVKLGVLGRHLRNEGSVIRSVLNDDQRNSFTKGASRVFDLRYVALQGGALDWSVGGHHEHPVGVCHFILYS